jgi:hypothetical protein
MSTITTTVLPAKQSRGTVAILNTVRWIGTGFHLLIAAILLLMSLVAMFTADNGFLVFLGGLLGVGMTLVFGALFYATVGWFVDTLSQLNQIAANTAPTSITAL